LVNIEPVDIGLFGIFIAVLMAPFLWKKVESNLEVFLLAMGLLAALISGVLHSSSLGANIALIREAAWEPLAKGIVPAVLVAGLVFHCARGRIRAGMSGLLKKVSLKWIVFAMVAGLGFISSVVTAIVAALILVELACVLPLDSRRRAELAVIGCFSIGLGAVLTPMGEPLSTLAVAALQGPPHNAGFFFLLVHLGAYVVPGLVAFGIIAALRVGGEPPCASRKPPPAESTELEGRERQPQVLREERPERLSAPDCAESDVRDRETYKEVLIRVLKVYIFVVGLIFLAGGLSVLIERYIVNVPASGLYWMNTASAVLDNATLTAAEISARLSLIQIKSALLGLLLSGGMLIPGNIPNIIAAGKLKISSREWARLGIPLGLAAMVVYFVWISFVPFP
jgi:predicted cation transporter